MTGTFDDEQPARPRHRARLAAQASAIVAIGAAALVTGVYVLPQLTSVEAGNERTTPSAAQSPRDPSRPTLPGPEGPLPGGAAQQPGALTPVATVPPTLRPTPTPTARPGGRPADALAPWALSLARLGIPPVALQAYGHTEMVMNRTQPGCKLSWTMLAGIGAVESNHGRSKGATLKPDGTSEPPVIGIPLDGTSSDRITDTDGGVLDGNKQFDQAMGPMQFIPSTWKRWAVDADNDQKPNPFDIDDAAMTAGRYLCANGRDLTKGTDWWNAVLSYNNVPRYASLVYAEADRYGRTSLGA